MKKPQHHKRSRYVLHTPLSSSVTADIYHYYIHQQYCQHSCVTSTFTSDHLGFNQSQRLTTRLLSFASHQL